MNARLQYWNAIPADDAAIAVLPCCGSRAWATGLAARRPIPDENSLLLSSDDVWASLAVADWDEAFQSHPRIGERKAVGHATATSLSWSSGEQSAARDLSDDDIRAALAQGNEAYEAKFGRIYIVCASGKTAREMLSILQRRMNNDPEKEVREAAEQQRQITHLRLKKWLEGQ